MMLICLKLLHGILPHSEITHIIVTNVSSTGTANDEQFPSQTGDPELDKFLDAEHAKAEQFYYINGIPLSENNVGNCTHEEKMRHLEALKGQKLDVELLVTARYIYIMNVKNANKQDISLCS